MIKTVSLLLLITLFGCKQAPEVEELPQEDSAAQSNILAQNSCKLSDLNLSSELGSPKSIGDVIELINALPRPLTIPCFLSALNRPLKVNLTSSGKSVQPAKGDESPRVFIMNMPLVISVAIEGNGSYLMEFSEFTTLKKSIKGELSFPIEEEVVSLSAAFERIDEGNRSSCAGCHLGEQVIDTDYPAVVYESLALKPENGELINVYDFKNEVYTCDLVQNPAYRCELIYGIFSYGEVVHENFPAQTLTFFQSFSF